MSSARFNQAIRRFADQQSTRIAAARTADAFYGTVTTVTPGASVDGLAVVGVTYRGVEMTAVGYPDSYTPAVGHRVLCLLTTDSQLAILHRSVGAP